MNLIKKCTLEPKQGGGAIQFEPEYVDPPSITRHTALNGDVATQGYEIGVITVSRTAAPNDEHILKLFNGKDQAAYFKGKFTWSPPDDSENPALTYRFEKANIRSYFFSEGENEIRETFEISVSDELIVNNCKFPRIQKRTASNQSG